AARSAETPPLGSVITADSRLEAPAHSHTEMTLSRPSEAICRWPQAQDSHRPRSGPVRRPLFEGFPKPAAERGLQQVAEWQFVGKQGFHYRSSKRTPHPAVERKGERPLRARIFQARSPRQEVF